MIAYVRGRLSDASEEGIVVETGGLGYHIQVPASVLGALPPMGSDVRIYTCLSVREDAMKLFGFLSREDVELFRMLIAVSGIGPKGALGILSVMTADELRFAVLAEDAKAIAAAPGIGKKTAQKLILELRDKLKLADAYEARRLHGQDMAMVIETGARDEAMQALIALGYGSTEALRAVRSCELPAEADAGAWLKEALKHIL